MKYCGVATPFKGVRVYVRSAMGMPGSETALEELYVTRGNKLHLAGFFSAKLRGSQVSWLPCEIEALSITTATKHFSPYIIQSNNNACILTDSKPCVQAFQKLCCGEFSTSPRVSTFLSVVSHFQASVRHVSGAAILPSDFSSRNTPPCQDVTCQVCAFLSPYPRVCGSPNLYPVHSPRPCEITFHNPCILVSHPVRVQRSQTHTCSSGPRNKTI